ncbi:outer membrane protein [Aeromonas caviae]|uniref:Outer membrane protein n=1 Tax=Aeromonas caviae TaxID=648 RepID=A0A6S4T2W1_AERCA|nr:porin [Aeromonas caviae]BBQ30088.1 outer membrane protein [Aeromonas caviae]
MKKTILAIAIPALFASAANAAVVYEKDGTTFDIYGRVQATYYAEHDDADGELKGQTRLGWSGTTALNDTWSAFARTEWQVAGENSGDYKVDAGHIDARHIYVGLDGSQYGKVLFGQTDTAYYTGLVERTDIMNEWGNEANAYGGRKEGQVVYMGKWGGFFANASFQTNDESAVLEFGSDNNSEPVKLGAKVDHGYAASAGYDFDFGLGLAAGYARTDFKSNTIGVESDKEDWALAASYAINGFYFAGLYNESQVNRGIEEVNFKGYELVGSYNVDAWTFLAGYNFSKIDDTNNSTVVEKDVADFTYLGVQYNFTSKLKAYTEYKIVGLDNEDDQFVVSLQYNF